MTSTTPTLEKNEARSRIEHEDNLINHRVSWLIGSQSFLFTAFVLLRNNPAYYAQTPLEFVQSTSILVYFISLTGILVATCSFVGVIAAFYAIRAWKSYAPKESRSILTSNARIAHFGGIVAILPGPVIASMWGLLLHTEWPAIAQHIPFFLRWIPLSVTVFVIVTWILFNWRLIILQTVPRDDD